MSRPFAAPNRARTGSRRRWRALRRDTGAAFAAGLLLAAGCTVQRAPLPLDSPDESAAVAPEPTPVAADPVVEEEPRSTIEEEALSDGDAPAAGVTGEPSGDAIAVEPGALLGTITAATAPNIAAATRLVDAARARLAAGDDGAALEQLERAIAIDSSNPYAYYYLAELHLRHGTYDQAIAFADRAASLSDARAPAWASRAFTLQGNAFEAAGRFADARRAYTRAIQAAPGNLAAQVGLARVGSPPAAQP